MDEISGTTAKPYKQKVLDVRDLVAAGLYSLLAAGFVMVQRQDRLILLYKKIAKIALSDVIKLKLQQEKVSLFSEFGSDVKTAKVSNILRK